MLKPILALALPAVAIGIGLAQTTPECYAAYLAAWRGVIAMQRPIPQGSLQANAGINTGSPDTNSGFARGTTTLDPDRFGQYNTEMEIGGRTLSALVDTGASFVALSYEDAASIGIHPADQAFTLVMQTANGKAKAAPAMIPRIRVGNVEAYNVQAIVSAPGALTLHNLLGMSFLKKLSGLRVDDGRLILRQ